MNFTLVIRSNQDLFKMKGDGSDVCTEEPIDLDEQINLDFSSREEALEFAIDLNKQLEYLIVDWVFDETGATIPREEFESGNWDEGR